MVVFIIPTYVYTLYSDSLTQSCHAFYSFSRYISHPTDHYCSFIVTIRPLGTDSVFEVIWKPDWVGNFRKVMQANRKYSYGVILRNKPFDEKLWSEMIDRCE